MASNYPGSLDSFDTIASDKKTSDSVGGRTHRDMHNDLGDAIEAIETELGTDPAGASATVKARFEVIEANDWVTSARIAADAVGSSEIAANAVGSSELADSAVDTAAIQDGAVTAAKLAVQPGNLLTDNQASGTDTLSDTTGFYGFQNCSIARSTAQYYHGTGSLLATQTGGTSYIAGPSTDLAPVGLVPALETVTLQCKVRAGAASSTQAFVRFLSNLGNVDGAAVAITTSGWATAQVTLQVPVGVTEAYFFVVVTDSSGTGSAYIDDFGLWRGAGGAWSARGVPVVGQSPILLSPDGTQYVLAVDNSGVLSAEEL